MITLKRRIEAPLGYEKTDRIESILLLLQEKRNILELQNKDTSDIDDNISFKKKVLASTKKQRKFYYSKLMSLRETHMRVDSLSFQNKIGDNSDIRDITIGDVHTSYYRDNDGKKQVLFEYVVQDIYILENNDKYNLVVYFDDESYQEINTTIKRITSFEHKA